MNNTYFKIYNERIHTEFFQDLNKIYSYIENPVEENIQKLVKCIEATGAHGWFGLAAEITDILNSSGKLDEIPHLKIAVELEKQKRLQYMGFINPVFIAKNNVINLIYKYRDVLDENLMVFFEMQTLGHWGWVEKNHEELNKIITKLNKKLASYDGDFKSLMLAFNIALYGRYLFLIENIEDAKKSFNDAIDLLKKENLLRPLAHVQMYYAEHLNLYGDKNKAVEISISLVEKGDKSQFKSHLILKALKIIIENIALLELRDKNMSYYIFRYHILVYAMGLNQSHRLYPILSAIENLIPENLKIDFYYFDAKEELRERILRLDWEEFEKFMISYYRLLEYEVIDLPGGFPAFDFIVNIKSVDSSSISRMVIQVKCNKKSTVKSDVPGFNNMKKGLSEINEKYGDIKITHYKWFTIKKITTHAFDELYALTELLIGKNSFEAIDMHNLIVLILQKPHVLLSLLFSNDLNLK